MKRQITAKNTPDQKKRMAANAPARKPKQKKYSPVKKTACERKRFFASHTVAKTVANFEGKAHNTALRVYKCPDGCGGYHLTSQRRKKRTNL